MPRYILGISAFYHDSAAALLKDGVIIAAAHEERFSRKKQDAGFPTNAIKYCLDEAGIEIKDLEAIAFYDKPLLKFKRLLATFQSIAPKGLESFLTAMPIWSREKLFMKSLVRKEIKKISSEKCPPLFFPEHHLSHGASAFYPSPFQDAAILTIDGVGEWATTTIGHGTGKDIKLLRELRFPHSLGLLYSAFTFYCGFKVNSGEYKLMGLAPYGCPEDSQTQKFRKQIVENLVDIKKDGSFLLNMEYFGFTSNFQMTDDNKWEVLFGLKRRTPESELTTPYMNLALAIQMVTEEIVLRLARTAKRLTGSENVVLAGGVALNCVANGKLQREKIFGNVWVQPAAGDAGGALGAAQSVWHIALGQPRVLSSEDSMNGAYLGPRFETKDVEIRLDKFGAKCHRIDNFDSLTTEVANYLAEGNVVGWFQGRMEYGPRALGSRSILADPRHPEMQKKLNLKIKFREGFRPFAPSVLEEDSDKYFEMDCKSPYMMFVAPVSKDRINPFPNGFQEKTLKERLYFKRSDVPSITHIDYSARIQTVSKRTNPRFWNLISSFKNLTGYGLLVNTSFNVRGEPIVCTPEEAYLCFMRTEMDILIVENLMMIKSEQPLLKEAVDWQKTYVLD